MSPPPKEEKTSTSPSSSAPGPARRACDCCRKRKIRCDSKHPCGPCRRATIRCAYLQPPKKKGPKGLRSAQVLRALREIDEAVPSGSDDSTVVSPHVLLDGHSQWPLSSVPSPRAVSAVDHEHRSSIATTSADHDFGYRPIVAHAYPQPALTDDSLLSAAYSYDGGWSPLTYQTSTFFPPEIQPTLPKLPSALFRPYSQLFFEHLFTIMPVLDPTVYLDRRLYDQPELSPEIYPLLCALSAATIVQLESSVRLPSFDAIPGRPISKADMFIEECLRTRKPYDYVGSPNTLTILTSFFLFAYYGNKEGENSCRAWQSLQESISYAELLGLDDESAIGRVDPVEAQWRRRLFWLLFVTERAYAIQRHKYTRLRATIDLPHAIGSEYPRLLNGFVNLVNLFKAVDNIFVGIWRGNPEFACSTPWLTRTQSLLDNVVKTKALDNVTETQRLDILVSREWLHVLAWQMGVANKLIPGTESGMTLEYPVELARKVVNSIERARASHSMTLDSHGIGMEQKLSDIGGCLSDVLRCTANNMSNTFIQGRQYLHMLALRLSEIRGKESRYLEPLKVKAGNLLSNEIPPGLSLPVDIQFTNLVRMAPIEEDGGKMGDQDEYGAAMDLVALPQHWG